MTTPELTELSQQRRNTTAFIAADPIDVTLTPVVETTTPTGGAATTPGPPRPPQRCRLIPMSHTERPERSSFTTGGSAGMTRRHDFTLLAEWDAVLEKNDFWVDAQGNRYTVDAVIPDNGYQRKGLVTLHRGPL